MSDDADASVDSEKAAAALVREFLSRKGYRKALAELDAVRPRKENDISSRIEIMKELKLDKLVKHNRERERPLATMLEVVVENLLLNERGPRRPGARKALSPDQLPATLSLPSGGRWERSVAEEAVAPPGTQSRARETEDHGFRVTCSELPSRAAAAAGEESGPGGKPVVLRSSVPQRLVVKPTELGGQSCDLEGLRGCEVLVFDWSAQVRPVASRGPQMRAEHKPLGLYTPPSLDRVKRVPPFRLARSLRSPIRALPRLCR